jgi:uncharacterized protein YjiS (DUF1127 family)
MTQHILTVSNFLLNPISEFLNDISSFSNKLAKSYNNAKLARATIKELQALTDKELNDIGIARGDIYHIAHNLKETEKVRDKTTSNENLKGWV